MKKNTEEKIKIIRIICIIIIGICLMILIIQDDNRKQESKTYKSLKETISTEISIKNTEISTEIDTPTEETEVNTDPVILEKYTDLYKENNDLIGWITDNNTIDYPIMQCDTNTDSNFYLRKDFYKKYSTAGSIYIPNDISINDKIVLIYGHNMKNGTMFASLKNYLNKAYFDANKTIYINSIYKEKEYEVIAVFISKIYPDDYTGFEYYNYRGDITESEFDEYIDGIKPLIQIGNIDNITYEDNLAELITCWYSEEDARLIVLCKEIQT